MREDSFAQDELPPKSSMYDIEWRARAEVTRVYRRLSGSASRSPAYIATLLQRSVKDHPLIELSHIYLSRYRRGEPLDN